MVWTLAVEMWNGENGLYLNRRHVQNFNENQNVNSNYDSINKDCNGLSLSLL